MKEGSMPELLKDYYGRLELPPDELAALVKRFQPSLRGPHRTRPQRKMARRGMALVLGLAFAFLVAWSLMKGRNPGGESGEGSLAAAHNIVEEVAMNHNKRLDIEFPDGSFPELGRSMEKLDFWLAAPSRLEEKTYEFAGGRYCSLQGHLAAQIKLNRSGESTHTLLVAAAVGGLAELPEIDENYKGIRVRIWKEAGLIYALASNLDSPGTAPR